MPGGNGQGPFGAGPMTGRARGYCAGFPSPGYANPVPGRGRGYGFGRGWGRGWGRGLAWRHGWAGYGAGRGYAYRVPVYYGPPNAPGITPQEEADILKEQAKVMQDELESVNRRISELESADKKDG